jgi:hypothetical protein
VFLSDLNVNFLIANAYTFLRFSIAPRIKFRNYLFLFFIIIFTGAGIEQSVWRLATGWTTEGLEF